MNKRLLFYFVVILQSLFLLLMTSSYYVLDYVGSEIRLKTEPVDPRDLFYGDYVILQYDISTVSKDKWVDEEEPKYGEAVLVVIKEKDGFHEVIKVSHHRPKLGQGEVLLKGIFQYDQDDEMNIEYGFERYYVPEGTGKEIEEKRGNLAAYIRVAPWGQFKIDRIEFLN